MKHQGGKIQELSEKQINIFARQDLSLDSFKYRIFFNHFITGKSDLEFISCYANQASTLAR